MEEKQKRFFVVAGAIALGIAVALLGIGLLGVLGVLTLSFLSVLRGVLAPVFVGFLFAYILTPLVDGMEKVGLHRVFAILVLYLAVAVGLVLGVMHGVPIVINEVGALFEALVGREAIDFDAEDPFDYRLFMEEPDDDPPDEDDPSAPTPPELEEMPPEAAPEEEPRRRYEPGYIPRLWFWLRDLVRRWNERFADRPELQISPDMPRVRDLVRDLLQEVRDMGRVVYELVRDNLRALVALLFFAWLVPIYAFFFLMGMHSMRRGFVEFAPAPWRERLGRMVDELNQCVSSFYRGRLVIGMMDGALLCIALYFAGTRFWLVMGVVSGLLGIVPIIGPSIAFFPVMLLCLFDIGVFNTLIVGGVFWIIQGFDGFVMTPLVLGNKVSLHPLTLIIVLLGSGSLFGPYGVLAAVPVVSVVRILLKEFVTPRIRALDKGAVPLPDAQETK